MTPMIEIEIITVLGKSCFSLITVGISVGIEESPTNTKRKKKEISKITITCRCSFVSSSMQATSNY